MRSVVGMADALNGWPRRESRFYVNCDESYVVSVDVVVGEMTWTISNRKCLALLMVISILTEDETGWAVKTSRASWVQGVGVVESWPILVCVCAKGGSYEPMGRICCGSRCVFYEE